MKTVRGLMLIESKKFMRSSKTLALPFLFYLLACVIVLSMMQMTPEIRIFLWILVSLSLKLSFGAFLHEDADQHLISTLIARRILLNRLLLIKVFLATFIFSALFMLLFLGGVLLHVLTMRDVMLVPSFVGAVLVLQAGIEVLTLKTKSARYLCYLLLLPLEIPLLILVISQDALTAQQLIQTMGGFLVLALIILMALCTSVFRQNKNACNF